MRRASFNARSLAVRFACDNRDLKIRRRRRQRERQKSNRLSNQNNKLHVHHAFLYISLPSLHDYDMKVLNFTFYRASNTSDDEISFLFLNLDMVLRDSTLGGLTYI